jgi:hypothetical protein
MPSRFISASIGAAIAGLIGITVYLAVERCLVEHVRLVLSFLQLLQWDASNFYGAAAFQGGWGMALRGLGADFVVALIWALIFTALYEALPLVRRYPALSGLCYGVVVMIVMIFVVVPQGHAVRVPLSTPQLINILVAHALFFGLPVGMMVDNSLAGGHFRR